MKDHRRTILHVDLDPFFVSVERSLDSSLHGRPVVVGGDGAGLGFVAAASEEARRAGVRVGMPVARARLACPGAAFRRGDLDIYGRCSEEVTAVLLAASRRVERPSADEAFLDLTADGPGDTAPVRAAEGIREELQRRLGLDASLGLASSRLAARIASGWAKPRGLLVVFPGYERSFLAGQPVSVLGLPPHAATALEKAGLASVGQVADAEETALAALVGTAVASRVRAIARGEQDPRIAVAAPPDSVQEESAIRARGNDRVALEEIADGLARRAARRLKPFRLVARAILVEVRRAAEVARRTDVATPGLSDEDAIAARVRTLLAPLLEPAEGVRALQVRLARLEPSALPLPLFPATPALGGGR